MDEAYEAYEVTGTIKWFDPARGLGFITQDNGADDVLLHVTALLQGGYETAHEGARIACLAQPHPGKGLRAVEVLDLDQTPPKRSGPHRRTYFDVAPETDWEPGTVAWFNRVRGFGFIVLDSGGRDLFVHMEHVRGSGMLKLRPRQRVLVRWGNGPKGAQAVAVRPAVRGDA